MAGLARHVRVCNTGNSHLLTEVEPCPIRGKECLVFSTEPVAGELMNPTGKPTTAILLNGGSLELTSKWVSLYTLINTTLRPHQRSFFVYQTAIVRAPNSTKYREIESLEYPVVNGTAISQPFPRSLGNGESGWGEDGGAERIRSRNPGGNGVFWTGQVCYTHERTEVVAAWMRLVKIKPDTWGRDAHEPLPLTEELLTAGGFQGTDSLFSLVVWFPVV